MKKPIKQRCGYEGCIYVHDAHLAAGALLGDVMVVTRQHSDEFVGRLVRHIFDVVGTTQKLEKHNVSNEHAAELTAKKLPRAKRARK